MAVQVLLPSCPPHYPCEANLWVSESFSLAILCNTQTEIDTYWDALTADGGEGSACCWLKDKFGLSWQLIPRLLDKTMRAGGQKSVRAQEVMFGWRKPDLKELVDALEAVEG